MPSHVWHYFKKVCAGKKARCCVCKKELAFCGSTSSLAIHLQRSHKIVTKKPQSEEDINEINISDEESNQNESQIINQSATNVSAEKPSTSNHAESSSPIIKMFQNVSAYSKGGERTSTVNDALLYMIAVDNMPFSAPEKRGFKKFCKVIQPLYKAPCLKTRENMMQSKYQKLKSEVFDQLGAAKNIVLTTDLWTEIMTVKSFLGVTAHYIDGIELKSVDIGARHIVGKKTISNLEFAINEICKSWNIKQDNVAAVVTDNGPNIVGACRSVFGADKHIRCFAHTLNLVAIKSIDFYTPNIEAELPVMENSDEDEISDETGHSELKSIINKIKKIVCFFKKSEAASTYLNDLQKESGKQPKRLIQEIKTRWNSLYEMVERYLELHEFVSRALRKLISEKTCKPPNDISLDEIESLVEIKELLKPLFLVTKELCSEKNVTASKVIPLLKLLKNNIENILPIGAAFDLRRKLLLNLNDRFSKVEEHPILSVATLLDPRYKKIHFHQESNVEAAIGRIAKYLEKINQTSNDEPPPPPPKRSRDSNCLWQIHDDLVDSQNETIIVNEDNGIPFELAQYLKRPVCSRHTNPIEEWEQYKQVYPNLYLIAQKYIGILATSVPCERLFSKAGLIITQRRNRLSSENLDQQLFLQNISEEDWFKK